MIKPTIHLNGTAPEVLRDQYLDASVAIGAALDALEACAPNERDYLSRDVFARSYRTALDEHRRRINCLRGVLSDLRALAEHVQSEIDARDRQRSQ